MKGLIDLDAWQAQLAEWRDHNFPGSLAEEQLLGAVEEAGELAEVMEPIILLILMGKLAHADIKMTAGIRESTEDKAKDAVGDITIFLGGYCQRRGWSLADIMKTTAAEVLARDWTKNTRDGKAVQEERRGLSEHEERIQRQRP